jgi:aarF domain-containing kinase
MRISKAQSIYAFRFLFLWLASQANVTSGSADPTKLVQVVSGDQQKGRIGYVQKSLCDRFDYVNSGRRASDFRQWIRSRGDEPKAFPMHGVDVNFEIDEQQNLELEVDVFPLSKQKKDDPFLSDRMNLNFPHDFSHNISLYNLDTKSIEEKPATAFELYIRAVQLSFFFGPVISTAWLAMLSKKFRYGIWYKWTAQCLASSGAAFIKWGQWAATRTDMFDEALCDALSTLHSSAPSHSWNFTQAQMEASLDIPQGTLFEVFDSFDPEPIASGSIAQVHKARLHNGGVVAAKVRHPKVARLIDMDFRLMGMLVTVCDWIPGLKWLHVKESVSQFSHTMAAQAHLNVEAHNLEVFNHNFQSWGSVEFPRPFFASSCLILETFEKGRICTDVLDEYDDEAEGTDTSKEGYELIPLNMAKFLVTTGVSLYLKMLLVDNIMHADLHPGNIMIDFVNPGKDGEIEDLSSAKFRIALVDAGMVAQLTDEESSTFIGLMTSLGEGDGRAAAEFAMRFSVENTMDEDERTKFREEMCNLFAKSCKGYGTNVNVGYVLRGVLILIRDHRVRIDPNYATLVINALCIESLARRVCPTYNVLDSARPLLEVYRRLCYLEDGFTPKSKDSYHKVRFLECGCPGGGF